ncbi:thiol reductant ABC exporter subunit CydD [Rhizohabitans arisaemae]|uniref:thiol reductant ABC exporter subunit CydD n=1 Tax=Rhizohabitans arisaemae TaxID=2720610 RepID=UPI0024B059ED|nr:thiol reductant ABC exporter subunit CydD [Rhizohabitans arisaemae]
MHKDLVRLARGRHLYVCLLAAVAAGLLVLVQAELLAGLLSGAPLIVQGAALAGVLATVIASRAGLVWIQGVFAARTATALKLTLRNRLLAHLHRQAPGGGADRRSGELVTLTGRGLDSLDPYITGYLPQAAVAAVIPVAVLIRLTVADLATAVIVLLTLPLIPIFGALVGWQTKVATERQWHALTRLGGHFLDVVQGLPTLRVFGRARHQATVIRSVADAHRSATMATLRIAFLSSLVLELVATLSLALVAVPVGLRLLAGSLDLHTALLVLILAPEAYVPLRVLGLRFHAAMEGVAAADQAFAALAPSSGGEQPGDTAPGSGQPAAAVTPRIGRAYGESAATGVPPEPGRIRFEAVTVRFPGRAEPALDEVHLAVEPGECVALVGPSGAGKSTLLHLLLGFARPAEGRILIDGVDLAALAEDRWRRELAFVPQNPHLFATTIAENIRLGSPDAPLDAVREAAVAAHADEFVSRLPHGYDTELGERGLGLSAGQRQRIALARAFLRDAPILLLDEPTARLDGRSEAAVVDAARKLTRGRTSLIVAHRPAILGIADRIVRVDQGRIVTAAPGPADSPLLRSM